MLLTLTIRDFVLVDQLSLDFNTGFGALTGETGAGKSILLDALSCVLGERADATVVRAGCERAEVAAEFDIRSLPAVQAQLAAQDLHADDSLLLRRVIDASGRSRAYINGSAATVQQLRDIGDALVDIHGQHAHQSLLKADAQRQLLDRYGNLVPQVKAVEQAWRVWQRARERHETALRGGEAAAREREQLQWEVDELEKLGFRAEEWAELNQEQSRLAHASSLLQGAQGAVELLLEGEGACADLLGRATAQLESLVEFDAALADTLALLQAAEADVREAGSQMRRYADRVDLDPQRLAEVDRRLDAILGTARKFRLQVDELPAALASRRQRLSELQQNEDPAALEQLAEQAGAEYRRLAGILSEARRKVAAELGDKVTRNMQTLALGGGRFAIALLPEPEGKAFGLERIEFQIAALAGNEARSLAKVASGGELSRISLALQVVASAATDTPTLIFDEVDVGIGGGVAEVVGRLLGELGASRQVLCVTHLPQVAARANWQWRVQKLHQGDTWRSTVTPLSDQARVEEIARMLGGMEITELTRQHATEMLAG